MRRTRILGAMLAAAVVVAACGSSHRSGAGGTLRAMSRLAVAQRFATAYLGYLDGRGPAKLADSSAAVTRAVVAGGTLPIADRRGPVRLVSLKPAEDVPGGVLMTATAAHHTFFGELNVQRQAGRWRVTTLETPDFLQAFGRSSTAGVPEPAGSRGAEGAARGFLVGYLPYLYGHGSATAIRGATPGLARDLAAHPPVVPALQQGLHAHVVAIGMVAAGAGWQAEVSVFDGAVTYQLALGVTHTGHSWSVSTVSSS